MRTINITKDNQRLLLQYSPDNGVEWIDERLHEFGAIIRIKKVFGFDRAGMLDENAGEYDYYESRIFLLGTVQGDYYKIGKNILGLKNDLLISVDMEISDKTFIAAGNISIFLNIDQLVKEQIIIGGRHEKAIPAEDFKKLLLNFPTKTELDHYANSRISGILKDYLGTITDAQLKLENYLKKKQTIIPESKVELLQEYETQKYIYIRDNLMEMLDNPDAYTESDWQKHILDFLLLLFPKYVAALDNVQIKDFYSEPGKAKDRFIDLALVDANGNIDIIEIKKPFNSCLLSTTKYRDNYIPKKELSGAAVQVEKYIFHLNKWSIDGEERITMKNKSKIPEGMKIRITNPKAILILGRDRDFSKDQVFDFEIIKRKYANIMDIMTYDDLLHRLDNIISRFQTK